MSSQQESDEMTNSNSFEEEEIQEDSIESLKRYSKYNGNLSKKLLMNENDVI